MPSKTQSQKTECLNPNTGGRMNIDAATYDLFSKAITYTLQGDQPLTYTQIVEGVKTCFQQQQTTFNGSVEWYAVTVKNDLQSRGILEVFTERGKKLHRLAKTNTKLQ
jgi:hypothetical protein